MNKIDNMKPAGSFKGMLHLWHMFHRLDIVKDGSYVPILNAYAYKWSLK